MSTAGENFDESEVALVDKRMIGKDGAPWMSVYSFGRGKTSAVISAGIV